MNFKSVSKETNIKVDVMLHQFMFICLTSFTEIGFKEVFQTQNDLS